MTPKTIILAALANFRHEEATQSDVNCTVADVDKVIEQFTTKESRFYLHHMHSATGHRPSPLEPSKGSYDCKHSYGEAYNKALVFMQSRRGETIIVNAQGETCGVVGAQTLKTYTVFTQDEQGEGTTHITSVEAYSADSAAENARHECASDWDRTCEESGYDETDDWGLRTLGVAEGNVNIIEWEDLC